MPGVHYYIRTCSNQCRPVYIMRVNFYFIKKFLYYTLLSTECYPFASNLKNLKIRAPNFCRNFIYIVLLSEIFFFNKEGIFHAEIIFLLLKVKFIINKVISRQNLKLRNLKIYYTAESIGRSDSIKNFQ